MTQISLKVAKDIADLAERDIETRKATIAHLETLRGQGSIPNLEKTLKVEKEALGYAEKIFANAKALYEKKP